MIEPESGYLLSRVATLRLGKATIRLPNVLFCETTGRDEYGNMFEALLTREAISTEKTQFVAPRNEMVDGPRGAETAERLVTMPNFIPFSSLIGGIGRNYEREREAPVFVAVGRGGELSAELEGVKAGLVDLSNAAEIARDPYDFILSVSTARDAIGGRSALYAPGVANPLNLALLIYSGVDIVDSTSSDLSAMAGEVFVDGSAWNASVLGEGVCHCPACMSRKADRALWHNRYQLLAELNRCRHAIESGGLREYLEARATSPWNSELLRYADEDFHSYFERHAASAGITITASTEHSLRRPEVRRYVNRFTGRYMPPVLKVLLLVPCSNRKPYFMSKSHRLFASAIRASSNPSQVHTVTVTSPLGLVPEELETVFPAAHYDIPVTGRWSMEEKKRATDMLDTLLARGNYTCVVAHLEDEREFITEHLAHKGVDFVDTSGGSTRKAESLSRLTDELGRGSGEERIHWEDRMRMLLGNIAAFQFGPGGRKLLDGTRLTGRYPNLRIFRGDRQLGMLTGQRGVISLTLDGAEAICREVPGYCVNMGDFDLVGNLFAPGVLEAGKDLRKGDEAIVMRAGAVEAVGVASMSALEMLDAAKGEAVHVRHLTKRAAQA